MKKVEAWVTSDGVVHTDPERARSHAEERYGNLLTKLAGEVARTDKYMAACEWLEANAGRLAELEALRRDREVEEGEE